MRYRLSVCIAIGIMGLIGHALAQRTDQTSFRDCSDICPEMVSIPPGEYLMGTSDADSVAAPNERKQHLVQISYSIAVGKYPVTWAEFEQFVTASNYDYNGKGGDCIPWTSAPNVSGRYNWKDPGFPQTKRDPVVCVSWNDALAYTAWLSEKTGKQYRLLSEAEWEYAARAGTKTAYFWGDSGDKGCAFGNLPDQSLKAVYLNDGFAVNCNDGRAFTSSVGLYLPNAFGLYDMSGNVWEWTDDCFIHDPLSWDFYKGAPTDGKAWTGGKCDLHMLRGGSWASQSRSAIRIDSPATLRSPENGFRVARTL